MGFYQSWYLIAHGVFNPPGWWQDQGVFIQWPLAILGLIWPHRITLLAVQDLAIVGAEAVAYLWICDLVAARPSMPLRAYSLTGLALLAVDPWIYWSASWDYHSEPLGTLFLALAARDLFRGRRRSGALWCFLTLLCGMVPATYLIGIGLSLMFANRRRLSGLCAAAVSGVWFVLLLSAGGGTTLGYAPGHSARTGPASKPTSSIFSSRIPTLFTMVMHHGIDLFANSAPGGLLGIFATPIFGTAAVVAGENYSQGNPNSVIPSFQWLPLYVLLPVGTVMVLMWLNRRLGQRIAHVIAAVLTVNAVGWAVVWLPLLIPSWMVVSPAAAASIRRINALVPANAAVVASQGISGDFAERAHVSMFFETPARLPLRPPYTWFIVAPYAGIETATVAQSAQLLAVLARDRHAKLEFVRAGIWAFRVRVSHAGSLMAGGDISHLSAAFFSTGGTTSIRGPADSWYTEAPNNAPHPALWGDYYVETIGRYVASVSIAGHGPATVQLWNDTTNQLLAARKVALHGARVITLPGAVTRSDPKRTMVAESGAGPFRITPVQAPFGNELEVRVYSTSAAEIRANWVSIQPVSST